MSSSKFLDEHLIMNIVSRLPVKSVLQCRCVCKIWRALFHELYFTQMHTLQHQQRQTLAFLTSANIPNTNNHEFFLQDYYYDDDDDDDDDDGGAAAANKGKWKGNSSSTVDQWLVIGSINGLLCFYGNPISTSHKIDSSTSFSIYITSSSSSFYICNPITREYLDLPLLYSYDNRCIGAIGFGYHPSTNEYKIVRIIHKVTSSHSNNCVRWVQIYTLGSGTRWRVRKEMGQTNFSGTGVYVANSNRGGGGGGAAIYWLDALDRIVSFDLEDEKFQIILTPTRCIGYELGEMAGEKGLCVIERSNVSTNIYILNNNNNNNDGEIKYSWSMKYSIPVMAASHANIQYKPIAVTRRGRVLCLCNKKFLISFDPSTETIESLGDITCFEGWSPIVSYIKSFVSLKSLGEKDAKKIKSGKKKRRRRSIDMKTEMIKLFTSLLQNGFVDC